MALDPTEIERIKTQTDLVSFIAAKGVLLTKNGRNHKGLCPFHEETTPSFTVNPQENLWHCFGCNAGGDVFNFVERTEKVGFVEAVRRVVRAGLSNAPRPPLKLRGGDQESSPSKREPTSSSLTANHQKLLNRVVQFYQQELFKDKRGLEYLKTRGIADRQSLTDFGVGFVAGNLSDMLPGDGDYEAALKQIGILNERGHEMFYGCVVFPLLDFNNNCVGLYGRRIDEDQVAHLYLPGPRRGLVNRQAAKRSKTLFLTESIIDALSLYANGFKNVIPLYGVNGFTEDHEKLFRDYPPETVYLCFDSDEAGMRAGYAVKERIKQLALAVKQGCHSEATPKNPTSTHGGSFAPAQDDRRIQDDTREQPAPRCKIHIIKLPVKDTNDFFRKYRADEFEKLIQETNPKSTEAPEVCQVKEERFFEKTDHGFLIAYGKREYEVKGIARMGTQLKATIKASLDIKGNGRFQITTLDLYSLRSREWFAKIVSELTAERAELVREDLNKILSRIENEKPKEKKEVQHEMSEAERQEALAFLKNPKLFDEILADLEGLGCTGEETNKLVAYLTAVSRKMEEPLSLLIQSRSAAGKSTLQDAILSLVPEEEFIKYTRLTDQALFYKEEDSLVHKILAIEEAAGIGGSAYSLRSMQSSKHLTVATTTKDPATGKMKTEEYKVKGPLSLMLTTTAVDLDAEMESRFITIAIDETKEMTSKIHAKQREQETLEGLLSRKRSEAFSRKHQNAQRLLKPLAVVNPYAPHLHFPSDNLRSRRDHKKYLNLMKAIAFVHQHQRVVKKIKNGEEEISYIEVTLADISKANQLANEVLGKSLDELSQPSRTLLTLIHKMVKEKTEELNLSPQDFSFNRRLVREYAQWSDWQVKAHIRELEELGFVYSRLGSRGKEYVYEIHHDIPQEPAKKVYLNLTDVSAIAQRAKAEISQLERVRSNLEGKTPNLVAV